jgi:hypothetical protein
MLCVDMASTHDPVLWGDNPDGANPSPGIVRAAHPQSMSLSGGWPGECA